MKEIYSKEIFTSFRKDNDLTMYDLSILLEVPLSEVVKIEHGHSTPSEEICKKFSKVMLDKIHESSTCITKK